MQARNRRTWEFVVNGGEDTKTDLTDRLRFAAGSLAADLGQGLSVDHAEALVFSSAEGLLAVPERDLTRLRNDVERARMRVSDWRTDLRRRSEPAT
jgi:hypothetical protein